MYHLNTKVNILTGCSTGVGVPRKKYVSLRLSKWHEDAQGVTNVIKYLIENKNVTSRSSDYHFGYSFINDALSIIIRFFEKVQNYENLIIIKKIFALTTQQRAII